jgi:hypothetical protein
MVLITSSPTSNRRKRRKRNTIFHLYRRLNMRNRPMFRATTNAGEVGLKIYDSLEMRPLSPSTRTFLATPMYICLRPVVLVAHWESSAWSHFIVIFADISLSSQSMAHIPDFLSWFPFLISFPDLLEYTCEKTYRREPKGYYFDHVSILAFFTSSYFPRPNNWFVSSFLLQRWHSATKFQLLTKYLPEMNTHNDVSELERTPLNLYESLIMPMTT